MWAHLQHILCLNYAGKDRRRSFKSLYIADRPLLTPSNPPAPKFDSDGMTWYIEPYFMYRSGTGNDKIHFRWFSGIFEHQLKSFCKNFGLGASPMAAWLKETSQGATRTLAFLAARCSTASVFPSVPFTMSLGVFPWPFVVPKLVNSTPRNLGAGRGLISLEVSCRTWCLHWSTRSWSSGLRLCWRKREEGFFKHFCSSKMLWTCLDSLTSFIDRVVDPSEQVSPWLSRRWTVLDIHGEFGGAIMMDPEFATLWMLGLSELRLALSLNEHLLSVLSGLLT